MWVWLEVGFNLVCVYDESEVLGEVVFDDVCIEWQFELLVWLVCSCVISELWFMLLIMEECWIYQIVMVFCYDFVNICFILDVCMLLFFNQEVVEVFGVLVINFVVLLIIDVWILLKFVFDWLFVLVVFMVFVLVMVLIVVLIKLILCGLVFFWQKCKGIDGYEFEIYKFCLMKVYQEVVGQVMQVIKNDLCVMLVGWFLCCMSFDELLQFINVLKGEMLVVGLCLYVFVYDDIYKDLVKGYMFCYWIKFGIIGWVQINGFCGEIDQIEKMMGCVKFDLYYMQNWLFWFDIKIVVLMLWKGFIGSNVY